MKNRIEKYKEIKKTKFNEAVDKRLAQDLARADDDGFAAEKIGSGAHATDEDPDRWSGLWQRIKASSTRFFR